MQVNYNKTIYFRHKCSCCDECNGVFEFSGKIKCGKVNVDHCPNTASNYGIRSIPGLLFFKNGEVEEQLVGAVPKQQITDIFS